MQITGSERLGSESRRGSNGRVKDGCFFVFMMEEIGDNIER